MSNMFEKYDKKIIEKEQEELLFEPAEPDRLVGTSGARIIRDVLNREMGVALKENSFSRLFFTFDGYVDDGTLAEFLKNVEFNFNILNSRNFIVYTAPVEVYADDCMASVDVITEQEGPLKNGTYRMQLDLIYNGIVYTLYSTRDGYLTVE